MTDTRAVKLHYERTLHLAMALGRHCRGPEHIAGPEDLPWFTPTEWLSAWWCYSPELADIWLPFDDGVPRRCGLTKDWEVISG